MTTFVSRDAHESHDSWHSCSGVKLYYFLVQYTMNMLYLRPFCDDRCERRRPQSRSRCYWRRICGCSLGSQCSCLWITATGPMITTRQARGDSSVAYTAHVDSSSDDDNTAVAATPGAPVTRGGTKGGQATIPGTVFNLVNNIVRSTVLTAPGWRRLAPYHSVCVADTIRLARGCSAYRGHCAKRRRSSACLR